jgi:hypothetical protein
MSCYYFFRTLLHLNDYNASSALIREIYDNESDICNKKYFKDRIEKQLSKNDIDDILNYKHIASPHNVRKSKFHMTVAIFFHSPFRVKTYMIFNYPIDKIKKYFN